MESDYAMLQMRADHYRLQQKYNIPKLLSSNSQIQSAKFW